MILHAEKHVSFQDEVRLTAPCATPKAINLEECILCQKKKRSEYLSSGEIGRGCIVSLAKQTESYDTRAARVLQLTVPEQGIIKYHASSCYRRFQRDMAKTVSITQPVEWLTTNYRGSKPLYLGISPQARIVSAGCASLFPRLNCTHEEADDRMVFHVQDILSRRSEPTSMTLSSGDTDVFVCLLYHFTVNWRNLGLQELWLIRNSGMRRSILPLHDICSALGNDLIKCLPAVHALTGYDTTSKIATKSAALNAVHKPGNSSLVLDFNSPQLTESSIQMAETFLVKCLKPTTDLETLILMTCVSLHSIAMPSRWTLKELLAPQPMQGNTSIAYYQLQLWVQAPFRDATLTMNAEAYGFERRGNLLVPEIVISKPEGLPDPCTCCKCARKNGCRCRVAGIKCCKYCKCKGGDCCQNPITE